MQNSDPLSLCAFLEDKGKQFLNCAFLLLKAFGTIYAKGYATGSNMKIAGPIVILEDDIDDQEILSEVFRDLGIHVELVFFIRPEDAFDFLKRTSKQPFLILSDVNLPGQSGIEFKRRIDDDQQLRQKSIPFVFYSTSVEKYAVDTAFKEMTVQGFFKKSSNYEDIKSDILLIMKYWYFCKHPNSVLG